MSFFQRLLLAATTTTAALAVSTALAAPAEIDRIVAIVNDDVITLRELGTRLESAVGQLRRQGTPLPPPEVLERQMLERMITDRLQLQLARDSGLRIDDIQLNQALERIAANNKLSMAEFRGALERDGIPFAKFREQIREELTVVRLREREVDGRMQISDAEVDNFIAQEMASGGSDDEYELAHILVRIPESATPAQIQQARDKADQVLARLRQGDDFAQVAAAYSDAPDALQGGKMARRAFDRLPTLFADAVRKLNAGDLTPALRSPNGFHIVKVLARHGSMSLPPVQQTRARHILIKVNELVAEGDARHKLVGLRERLAHGGDFAELARLYSQDGTAPKGGDLGWLYPGDTVPEFEQAMNALKPGEISEPIRSPFGFHLIEVLERKVKDVSQERQRMAARQALRDRRIDGAYQDWLRQLRDRAWVEIRLGEQ